MSTKNEPIKWDTWINTLIQGGILLITFFAFDNSRLMNQATLKTIAESNVRDSINSLLDSIRNERFLKLSGQQITALNQQVIVQERGVQNTERTQRPYLDVMQFGFHKIKNKDSLLLLYKIINYGTRPAILEKIDFYIFNRNFELTDSRTFEANSFLLNDKALQNILDLKLNGQNRMYFSLDEILHIDTSYCSFVISYIDPFLSSKQIIKNDPLCFSWIKRPKGLMTSNVTGNDEYFSFDLCQSDKKSKILNNLNKFKK
ncbi:MAG: hypothetical protein IPG55_00630 [Saprospiraceae bacterium]|nr:hypothetical protein [Candidatus Defluviibacterium haderslevense]MBK7243802.1 hypothetical protein [Candidatus Defluviibacterium haderslevense]